jgi:ketosteroid isomerase-like protein
MLTAGAFADAAPDAAELTKLVQDFLAGAGRNDVAMHDRFWADDLIYTGSSGRRVGKADIMKDVRSAPPPKAGDPVGVYTAEDLRVQQYGTTAIVAFRLVSTVKNGAETYVSKYLNSGTFLKRDGQWRVVNWQATKLPVPEEEAKKAVAAAEAAFEHALVAADAKAITDLTDDTFVWTRADGDTSREQLVTLLLSGTALYPKLEAKNVTIAMYGDAALVRGTWTIAPDKSAPFTMTLVNRGGAWQVVSLR